MQRPALLRHNRRRIIGLKHGYSSSPTNLADQLGLFSRKIVGVRSYLRLVVGNLPSLSRKGEPTLKSSIYHNAIIKYLT